GGGYRFVFKHPTVPGETMAFFGKYVEVSPHSRLVWTNDESGDDGQLSTLTLEDRGDTTRIVLLEVYPSGAAYEAGKGSYDGMPESFAQLDELLAG
ncbi:MAG TPA: SRPBCC domain-containing protein, partial [Polyangia bacterium]|nr:SRPBCC domain-containing protein [Polyangia bacterium]